MSNREKLSYSEWHQKRTCGNKRKYASQIEATKSAKRGLEPYNCPYCSYVHVGHPQGTRSLKV